MCSSALIFSFLCRIGTNCRMRFKNYGFYRVLSAKIQYFYVAVYDAFGLLIEVFVKKQN